MVSTGPSGPLESRTATLRVLRLLASDTTLIIEAWDHSSADPQPRAPGPEGESGRGLTVVAALSHRWGSERTGHHRKVVWAELAR